MNKPTVWDKDDRKLALDSAEALVVTKPANIRYLSGFTGMWGALFLTPERRLLLTDSVHFEQACQESPGFQVVNVQGGIWKTILEEFGDRLPSRIGFEDDHLTVSVHRTALKTLSNVELVPLSGAVEKLRMTKTAQEVSTIRDAVSLCERGLRNLLPEIRPGRIERDLEARLQYDLRRMGAEGFPFPYVIASGPRGALPHGEASVRAIQPGDLLTIDFGVRYKGYCSDMTRTFGIGPVDPIWVELYDIVLEAQMAALAVIAPGTRCSDVDKACRQVIEHANYGEYFGHGTGHGVGIEVHEGPRLSSRDDTILEPGMLVTIEPGIYLPGRGGIRIEEMAVVSETGVEVLTSFERDSLILL